MDNFNENVNHAVTPPQQQRYACLSFAVDTKEDKKSVVGVRIAGVFDKLEEAQDFSKSIAKQDPFYHVFIGELGKFLPFDPAPSSKESGEGNYANKELDDIIKENVKSQLYAQQLHNVMKVEKMNNAIDHNINVVNENKDNLLKDLSQAENEEDIRNYSKRLEEIERELKELTKEKEEGEEKYLDIKNKFDNKDKD
jgi:hypothetical protein